ncbi:MAG: undecaprenyl/decaprenyl-phosphate alpha-N-acetylglucosaminyl 1-phosphate transferase [Rhodanobacteraceae bacterium]|nr:undecaprenyl/decaprenyl-phosphate alpha-N-acetylglucosaminyl 1-phosphate transferase [Rhodanobacteraceae bacterium]
MLTALAVGAVSCWWLIGHAARMGLVDHPVGRKDHAHPTPVVGGISIFLASCVGWSMVPGFTLGSSAFGLLLAGAMLIAVGILDDLRDLKWHYRILVQSVAALTICWFGAELHSLSLPEARPALSLGWASMAFTAFAVVGIINAVNMIDGVDGLAGSIVAATLIVIAVLAFWTGLALLGWLLLVATVAIAAYLIFNLRIPGRPKALTFLGNSGSALLGLLVAWSAIELTQAPSARVTPSVAPWLVGLPILDCLTLIGRRLAGGRSPFSADRMHFHHLLLDRGFSVPRVVVAGLVLHLAIAGSGLGLMFLGVPDLALIAGFLGLLCAYAITVSLNTTGPALPATAVRGDRDAS